MTVGISKAERARRAEDSAAALESFKMWLADVPKLPAHGGADCDPDACEGHYRIHVSISAVARSGMSRKIKVLLPSPDVGIVNVSHLVARILGWRYCLETGSVIVAGCGMDMGFHLVYELSEHVFPGVRRNGYLLKHHWV